MREMLVVMLICAAASAGPSVAGTAAPGVPPDGARAEGGADQGSETGVIRVLVLTGGVTVRHGAAESWESVAAGDVLKPEDSIRLEDGASATIEAGGKKIALPPAVIIDVADLREMTRSDLLLRLAMEDVRSAPRIDSRPGNPGVARTTTTRAADREVAPVRQAAGGEANLLRLSGTKVLHDYGYYGTCVLRSKEIFRIDPALASRIDARLRIADALERMNLGEEAYDAYRALAGESLAPEVKKLVDAKLELLEKRGK